MIRAASQLTLDIVTRALLAVCVLVGIVIVVLSIRTVLDVRGAHVLDADSRVLEAQAKKHVEPLIQSAGQGKPLPRGLTALRTLQDAVTQDASNNHCQLAEFKAATQTTPYASHYKKSLPNEPWSQMDAHFSISGRLRDVMETLRSLNDAGVPIEIDGLTLSRKDISREDGSTTVSAQIDLRALAQGAPA